MDDDNYLKEEAISARKILFLRANLSLFYYSVNRTLH